MNSAQFRDPLFIREFAENTMIMWEAFHILQCVIRHHTLSFKRLYALRMNVIYCFYRQ